MQGLIKSEVLGRALQGLMSYALECQQDLMQLAVSNS